MPRTFQATVVLIVVLGLVALMAIISIAMTHQNQKTLLQVQRDMQAVNTSMSRIQTQLERGVAVAGHARGPAGDSYADSLDDPDNLLVAANDQLHHPDSVSGGQVRRAMGSDPAGFNWLTENSVDVRDIQYYVHQTVARRDFSNPDNYTPLLAHKVTANEDRTEYIVHLREGVYWQRPNVDLSNPRYEWLLERREMKAEDLVFFFEMARNPEVEAAHISNYVQDIETVEALDDYTVRITWTRPLYHSMSTVMESYPMPKWLFSRDRDGEEYDPENIPAQFNNHWSVETPIGTGPYRFIRFEAGNFLILERNDDFWGQEPAIERIEYQIIRDPEQQFSRLLSGAIDFVEGVSGPRYRSEIQEGGPQSPFHNGSLEHGIIDSFSYFYIGWNADKDHFSDRRVRKAMSLALNKQGIIDNVFQGLGRVQPGPYYHDHPANNPEIVPLPFDLERAAELLDEAGWIDTTGDGIRNKTIGGEVVPFRFTLVAYNQDAVRSWVAVYREDLRQLGIDMRADFVDWPLMQNRMEEKNFDAFTGGWGLSWGIDLYQIWHSSQADIPRGSNRVGFRNAEADEIIETLRETFDEEDRLALLHRFHTIVHEEQPYAFFYARQEVKAWNPRLRNMVFQRIRPQTYSLPWYIVESE
jgi:peptide/nickel transport system substrate-binding protein